jgi:hypothetical protein
MTECKYVQKDATIAMGKGAYRAITHDAVTSLLRDSVIKNGIVVSVSVLGVTSEDRSRFEKVYEDKNPVGLTRSTVSLEVTFFNIDDPTERLTVCSSAYGDDRGAMGIGKAISMATKYAYLKTFMIETGEDEESRVEQRDASIRISSASTRISSADAVHLQKLANKLPEERFNTWAVDSFGTNNMAEISQANHARALRMITELIESRANAKS